MTYAPIKDSDQPAYPPGLIKSLLCDKWVAKDPGFLNADSEASDQTGQMRRLIWVFAGRTSFCGSFICILHFNREDSKISHYIVNRIQVGGQVMFRIGDHQFPDIPALLNFYKTHYLDTTALTYPVSSDITAIF